MKKSTMRQLGQSVAQQEAAASNPEDSGSSPELAPKIPSLYCTICQQAIPAERARRQTATCTEGCKNKLDAVRMEQRRSRKCAYCLHPATPEERELFRVWRAERGDVRSADPVKRDKATASKRDLERTLKACVVMLEVARDEIAASETLNDEDRKPDLNTMDSQSKADYEEFETLIQRARKLIDTKGDG